MSSTINGAKWYYVKKHKEIMPKIPANPASHLSLIGTKQYQTPLKSQCTYTCYFSLGILCCGINWWLETVTVVPLQGLIPSRCHFLGYCSVPQIHLQKWSSVMFCLTYNPRKWVRYSYHWRSLRVTDRSFIPFPWKACADLLYTSPRHVGHFME